MTIECQNHKDFCMCPACIELQSSVSVISHWKEKAKSVSMLNFQWVIGNLIQEVMYANWVNRNATRFNAREEEDL